jgi:hypothetical protein
MKILASWIAMNYWRLIVVLIGVLAIVAASLQQRKKLQRSKLLPWWLRVGATLAMLTFIIAETKWLRFAGGIAFILLSSASLLIRAGSREELQQPQGQQLQLPKFQPQGQQLQLPKVQQDPQTELPSWFLSSLDPKDRKLLLWTLAIGIVFAAITGFFTPNGNSNDNPVPSSYHSGQHGARAAYETLLRSGYPIERWERPLGELAAKAGPQTVVVFAQPYTREASDIKAVRKILERGGRVLSTGIGGGYILPGQSVGSPPEFDFAACKLSPEGLDPLSGSGEVWLTPTATWHVGDPAHRIEYSCSGQPSVVEFDWGKGHAVWWASSTPLENGSIARAHNLDLFLNSLGPREGHHFYWDESLHGVIKSDWSYAAGPSLTLLNLGLPLLGLLVVFSFSRRAGPVRDLPAPPRTTPIEFLQALGALYRNAGAASTAVAVAWERFRRHSLRLCGLRGSQMGAAELASVISRRFPQAAAGLEADLAACEDAAWGETIGPAEALKLVQKLSDHYRILIAAAKPGGPLPPSAFIHPTAQERAS